MTEEKDKNTHDIEHTVNVVGMSKGKRVIVLAVAAVLAGLVYYFFFADSDKTDQEKTPQATEEDINKLLKTAKPVTQETAPRITITSQLPELPPLITPTTLPSAPIERLPVIEKPSILELPKLSQPPTIDSSLPLPPSIPTISGSGTMSPITTSSSSGYDKERRGSAMLVISGSSNPVQDGNGKKEEQLDDNAPLETTSAPQARATKVSNLGMTIIQGKILDAVLETAINSDLEGSLRAVMTRDVYAEAGNTIMIPKGSRLIGQYSFDTKPGQDRVSVTWNRVILPHGVDIAISSAGTDELGRQGLTGIVDDKIRNILTSSILLAGVSFGTAVGVSKIPGMNDQIVITPDPSKPGETTTQSSLPFNILAQSVKDFSETMKGLIQRNVNVAPTIYVDQGTLVKVFVNQDLIFPPEAISGIKVVH